MEELKAHFLSVVRQFETAEREVAEVLSASLCRQIFESMRQGLLTMNEVIEIDDAMPEGALYFDGNLLHKAA